MAYSVECIFLRKYDFYDQVHFAGLQCGCGNVFDLHYFLRIVRKPGETKGRDNHGRYYFADCSVCLFIRIIPPNLLVLLLYPVAVSFLST